MKTYFLIFLFIFPHIIWAQNESGQFAIGTQIYQNILLPENYQGFGVGVNAKLNIAQGFGIDANYFYEALDLMGAGSIKRSQTGLAIYYAPFDKKLLSPWVQLGVSYNLILVTPVSYLFSDNFDQVIKQNYFGLNIGVGAQYIVNPNLILNSGFYFQPQNYSPQYVLEINGNNSSLVTNHKALNLEVEPLLYFNLGITYKIANLW